MLAEEELTRQVGHRDAVHTGHPDLPVLSRAGPHQCQPLEVLAPQRPVLHQKDALLSHPCLKVLPHDRDLVVVPEEAGITEHRVGAHVPWLARGEAVLDPLAPARPLRPVVRLQEPLCQRDNLPCLLLVVQARSAPGARLKVQHNHEGQVDVAAPACLPVLPPQHL